MATRRHSFALVVSLVGWAAFGSWALWTDEVVGHSVAFFFFSVAFLGLAIQILGMRWGVPLALVLLGGIAAASEYLQPRFTDRPAEIDDVLSDLVGVGAAVAVVAVVAWLFAERTRLWLVVGSTCLVALLGSSAVAVAGSTWVEARLECRGEGYESITSVTGAPIIHVEGDEAIVGARAPQPLGDGTLEPDSKALRCSILRDGSFSIVATVTPASIASNGPTRIFTSSAGTDLRTVNVHIGQDFDELSVRIRSGDGRQWESIPGVFAAGEQVTVAVVVTDGRATIVVDGVERTEFSLLEDSFAAWDESYPILIGDETTRDRTFEGAIESVSFFDRALAADDVVLLGPAASG